MIVGVISDTHLSPLKRMDINSSFEDLCRDDNLRSFFNLIEPHFKAADAVIHAGDIIDFSVLTVLENFGDVYTVSGNMDPWAVKDAFPEKRVVNLAGFKIGITHGSGGPGGLPLKVRQKFYDEKVDCIVFGHSHQPYDRVEDGILMFNPGSALDRRFAKERTLGILHLDERIWGEHINLG
ncbi:MAG: metallophosphatase family protein [Spirochaetes bacterium]|nr:metallophosphatase family protein [Spirochaetota bacterium]